jgi:hypothetical protein
VIIWASSAVCPRRGPAASGHGGRVRIERNSLIVVDVIGSASVARAEERARYPRSAAGVLIDSPSGAVAP